MTLATYRPVTREFTPTEIEQVRAELSRILASDIFATSRRCRDFLACVTEFTLTGDQEKLTERFLGVELFGRAADYETATDSIVRVRANDVRRRLLQYYSTPRAESVVRVEMPSGRYVPEFIWFHVRGQEGVAQPASGSEVDARSIPVSENGLGGTPQFSSTTSSSARPAHDWKALRVTAVVSVFWVASALFAYWVTVRTSVHKNLDAFWQPVLDGQTAPILNLPTTDTFQLTMDSRRTLPPLSDMKPGESVKLSYSDFFSFHDWHISTPVMQAALSVANTLERKGKAPLVRVGTDLRRDEVRGHPLIAIGSFSNPWTEATVSGLRFTFDHGESDRDPPRIRDSKNPQRSWSLPLTYPQPQHKDYAIITRTFDSATGEPFVSLAGLHSFGNQIAGEFVSQPSSWDKIADQAPSGWQRMNLQILLEADIVGTTPGSPRIVDVYFWR